MIAALLIATLVRGAGPAPEVGYYHAASYTYGWHLADLPAGTQLAMVNVEGRGRAYAAAMAEEAAARGLRSLYYGHQVAYVYDGDHYRLRTDWRRRWELELGSVTEFLIRGALHSIYIADEPRDHGITLSELQVVTDWLHARGLRVSAVETMGWARAPRPTWEYYGLTCYRDEGGTWVVDWPACQRAYLRARANLVVGHSFQWAGRPLDLGDVRQSWRLARRIRAEVLLWFLWPSVAGLAGAESSPEVVAEQARLMVSAEWTMNLLNKGEGRIGTPPVRPSPGRLAAGPPLSPRGAPGKASPPGGEAGRASPSEVP